MRRRDRARAERARPTRKLGETSAARRGLSAAYLALEVGHDIRGRDLRRLAVASMPVFELAGLERAIADDQPVRDPDELRVGEFHAGSRVAIVEQHVDAGGAEILVQLVGRAAHALGFLV